MARATAGETLRAGSPASTPAGLPAFTRPASVAEEVSSQRATLEETLGGNWLNKLGIVILAFGVVSFLIWQFGGTPGGKIVLGYLTALGTLGLGIFLEKRERYRTLLARRWAAAGRATRVSWAPAPARSCAPRSSNFWNEKASLDR